MEHWKVGELARRTGITVRTLHHYDEIGLLSPAARSDAGYRLYTREDVARLQQILSLRQLGFSLEEIRACLDDGRMSPLEIVELHLRRVRDRIEAQRALAKRLEALAVRLRAAGPVPAEELIRTMEAMTMFEKYYTPEQLEQLEARRREIGEDRIREVEAEWPRLMAEVRAEMEKGTDPADERVQQLAARWHALVREFTGGDPGIERSLGRMYDQETTVAGMDTSAMRELAEYIAKAAAAGRSGEKPDE